MSANNAQNSAQNALGFLDQLKADKANGVYTVKGWRDIEDLDARRAAVDEFINTNIHKSGASRDGIPTFVMETTLSDRREYLMVQQRLAYHIGVDASSVRIQTVAQESGLLKSRETTLAGISIGEI
jgi:hypothetical protein